MSLPSFSRQSTPDNQDDDRAVTAAGPTHRDSSPRDNHANSDDDKTAAIPVARTETAKTETAKSQTAKTEAQRAVTHADRPAPAADHTETDQTRPSAPTRKPRASLLATLGLIFAVVGAMLVLSGPLVGYGIGVSALALILSMAGMHATGKWHVAGKTDALIGMVLALAAIALGVFALTGSLSWLGTDTQPATNLREWLDAQFENRF